MHLNLISRVLYKSLEIPQRKKIWEVIWNIILLKSLKLYYKSLTVFIKEDTSGKTWQIKTQDRLWLKTLII